MTAPVWMVSSLLAGATLRFELGRSGGVAANCVEYVEYGATPGMGARPVVTSGPGAGVPGSRKRSEPSLPSAKGLRRLATNVPGGYPWGGTRVHSAQPPSRLLMKIVFTKLWPTRRWGQSQDGSGSPIVGQTSWSEASCGRSGGLRHGP